MRVNLGTAAVDPRPRWLFLASNVRCGHDGPRGKQSNGWSTSWCAACWGEFRAAFRRLETFFAIKQRRVPF